MKAALTTGFLLVLAGSMLGCGQKGPLYREAPAEVSAEQTPAPETGSDRQGTGDERDDAR